jgi:hypothetical protein
MVFLAGSAAVRAWVFKSSAVIIVKAVKIKSALNFFILVPFLLKNLIILK